MKPPKPTRFILVNAEKGKPLPIVADGAVSTTGVLGGRLIPLVILDTSERPDIEELIRIHHTARQPGDVRFQWGQIEGHEGTVMLHLEFIRPAETLLVIEFDVVKQGILVDRALHGKGLYVQAGRPGDRVKNDINRPKVLVEIGDTGYAEVWGRILAHELTKHFRTKGLRRYESRRAASLMIQELRTFDTLRIRDNWPETPCK